MVSMKDIILLRIKEHRDVLEKLDIDHMNVIIGISQCMIDVINSGGIIYWCGNGGSAVDCQHLSTELCFRFKKSGYKGLPSISLTTDNALLTAIGNDTEFSEIFRVQVLSLLKKNDMLIGISTSGQSNNVCYALDEAIRKGCIVVGISGIDGFRIPDHAMNYNLKIPSHDTARIQEIYMLIGHIICEIVEDRLKNR